MRYIWMTWLQEFWVDTSFAVRHTLAWAFGDRITNTKGYAIYKWRGREYTITKG